LTWTSFASVAFASRLNFMTLFMNPLNCGRAGSSASTSGRKPVSVLSLMGAIRKLSPGSSHGKMSLSISRLKPVRSIPPTLSEKSTKMTTAVGSWPPAAACEDRVQLAEASTSAGSAMSHSNHASRSRAAC